MAYENTVSAPLRQLPNALTIARFVAIPLFVVLLVRDQDGPSWAAGIVFALAAITDQLDGWLARRWRVESAFGKVAELYTEDVPMLSLQAIEEYIAWHDDVHGVVPNQGTQIFLDKAWIAS